jgi:hypothetical protein
MEMYVAAACDEAFGNEEEQTTTIAEATPGEPTVSTGKRRQPDSVVETEDSGHQPPQLKCIDRCKMRSIQEYDGYVTRLAYHFQRYAY